MVQSSIGFLFSFHIPLSEGEDIVWKSPLVMLVHHTLTDRNASRPGHAAAP